MRKNRKWTEESIREVALKCDNVASFFKNYNQAYAKSKLLGIFEDITSHMKRGHEPQGFWTELKVREVAKEFKTIAEMRKSYSRAVDVARKIGILNDLFPSKKKPNGYWTEERIREFASTCESQKEFVKSPAYKAAYKMNIHSDIIDSLPKQIDDYTLSNTFYAVRIDNDIWKFGVTHTERLEIRFQEIQRHHGIDIIEKLVYTGPDYRELEHEFLNLCEQWLPPTKKCGWTEFRKVDSRSEQLLREKLELLNDK